MLTDVRIRAEKPDVKPRKLSDAGGLHLLINPNGSKLWRLAYRYGGKQKTLAIGAYPLVGLKEAREKRDAAKKVLSRGVDPSVERRQAKLIAATDNSFKSIAEELVLKREKEGNTAKTIKKMRWLLGLVYPDIGEQNVADITAPDLLRALRKIEARGRYETARRVRSTCGQVFRYSVASGRGGRDLSVDLRDALVTPKVRHRSTITKPDGIGALLRALDGYDGQLTTKAALALAPLLFVRPGELRYGEWGEFDLPGAIWTIPAEKMKMRRPHRVPLSTQAVEIVANLRPITGDGRYLFPSVRSADRPMSENTVNAALRRMGYTVDEMTGHGFRAMASTRLNEMGRWNPDAIERQLAHQEEDETRRAYIHAAEYWDERVEMMQAWADYLGILRKSGLSKVNKAA